jgi:hypothetical protein
MGTRWLLRMVRRSLLGWKRHEVVDCLGMRNTALVMDLESFDGLLHMTCVRQLQ